MNKNEVIFKNIRNIIIIAITIGIGMNIVIQDLLDHFIIKEDLNIIRVVFVLGYEIILLMALMNILNIIRDILKD